MKLTVLIAETYGRFRVFEDIRDYFVNTHSVDNPMLVVSTMTKPRPGCYAKNGKQMIEITSECSVVCNTRQAQLFKFWCEISAVPLRQATFSEKEQILKERQSLRTGLKKIAVKKKKEYNIKKVV